MNVTSEDETQKWIMNLEQYTDTTYRITRGIQTKGKRLIYKTIRHCQHKRKPSRHEPKKKVTITRRDKKTNCPSTLIAKIHSITKSGPKVYHTHPCEITLKWEHNHSIRSAHALSFRPIKEETKEKFYEYFSMGHSASSARHHHSLNLTLEHEGSELEMKLADRAFNPLPSDVYLLFSKWKVQQHGKESGESMFKRLEGVVEEYNNNADQGGCAYIQRYHNKANGSTWDNPNNGVQPLVLAVCTPLMARAHRLVRQAGELVYCDATASLDKYNSPTFIISTSSSAGGIPLGVVITSGESELILEEAFSFLKKVLPQNAFYGRGEKGPQLFITDDSSAERSAIRATWPDSTLLLCVFHYLQSWWSWLWDSKQCIHKDDKQPIIDLVKKMVFAGTESELQMQYLHLTDTSANSYTTKYPQILPRLQQFWERRTEWALSYRLDRPTRGNFTNNYAEAGIRVLKEIIFGRVKAYNLVQMFEFIVSIMENTIPTDYWTWHTAPGIALKYRNVHISGYNLRK